MGIIDSGLVGPFRKKVGPAIGRKHMGQDLVVPIYHKSTKKATDNQVIERDKFRMLKRFLASIKELINPGFQAYAKKMSPVNAAHAYNFEHAFIMGDDQFEINYPKIVYSRGPITTPYGLQVSGEPGIVRFSWHAQPQSQFCQFTDKASFLICTLDKSDTYVLKDVVDRFALGYDIVVPANFTGKLLHCYISFASANGKLQGNSKYAGGLTLA